MLRRKFLQKRLAHLSVISVDVLSLIRGQLIVPHHPPELKAETISVLLQGMSSFPDLE